MTDALATITVVVCAYTERRWEGLQAACTEATAQLRSDDQLILVVDHNDALLDRARTALTGVDVLPNTHARGLSGARNSALDKVTGDIVVFLDDDAIPRPGWLDALRAPYSDAHVYGVGGWAVAAWPDGRRPDHIPPELDWIVGCSYRGLPETTSPVRNLMGCNMSFRREVFDLVGGFDETVGRIGTTPLGCEETQLCIRLRQARPDVELLLEPTAVVDHTVSPDRLAWSYLRRRSYAEGVSKALISDDVGSDAMTTELDYTRRVLPAGISRDVGRWLRGDRGAAGSAAAVPLALGSFAAGYLAARTGRHRLTTADMGPVHVAQVDLADHTDLLVDDECHRARLLVRRGPSVLGIVDVPVRDGVVTAAEVRLAAGELAARRVDTVAPATKRASISVVIATAGRPAAVRRCVAALLHGNAVPDTIVIVDNAPHHTEDAAVLRALATHDGRVRYLPEPRAGASRARNAGVAAVDTDLVATVDDDVVVDRYWLQTLLDDQDFAPPVQQEAV